MRVVLLPLDERPCNFKFPKLLFEEKDFQVICPDKLGDKKVPADLPAVEKFLLQECKSADAAVIAMDTLLYGGLIPSRLHHFSQEEVQRRLDILRTIKKDNPAIKIYAFQCIMRCPRYSSDDEEPDYYGYCGEEIHRLGRLIHKETLSMECEEDKEQLLERIPQEALSDYVSRREFNLAFNLKSLELVKEGIVDFFVIPQDDSAPYGYTAMDQMKVRREVARLKLWNRAVIYPGADELEMTLLSRVMNMAHGRQPKVYVKYASVHAPFLIPCYEDRALGETVKYHLMAAGCIQTDSLQEADFVLALSAGAYEMIEAPGQPAHNRNYDVERNLTEFVYAIQSYMEESIPVTVGDNAYANGSDLELVALLDTNELLLKLAGYAGWNTSANTIGTAVAEGVKYLYYDDNDTHRQFLVLRYLEDAGYCAVVRQHITDQILPSMGMTYFDIQDREGMVSDKVMEELNRFAREYLTSIYEHISIEKVIMPWKRMFETDIEVIFH